ncbi:hypothetical protein AB0K04_14055 [Micromonospora coxensis]|uniref:hypothetical protein n=1 Tax=Micromonospora coxensis TaxID=356852 RepID=UPI003439B544
MNEDHTGAVDRRRLLRRASTVAAGLAGGAAVGAATAGPAQAAVGEPVLQGRVNDAGANGTTLRGTAAQATLQLENTVRMGADGIDYGQPTLRLHPNGYTLDDRALPGSIGMTNGGEIQMVRHMYGTTAIVHNLFHEGNSNRIVPVPPFRAVDTRYASSRTTILNASGNLDSSGRLLGGRSIDIDLSQWVYVGDALFGNVTVTGPTASGFVQVYQYGVTRPTNFSTINFTTGQTLSNSVMTGIGYEEDRISVYASKTTHVIIDVVAFVIGVGRVNFAELMPAGAGLTGDSHAERMAKRAVAAQQGRAAWE